MPEPVAGRQNQEYVYEAAKNWADYAACLGVSCPIIYPEPSEPKDVLLMKLAWLIYCTVGGTPPPSPCTGERYLLNIAQNTYNLFPYINPYGMRPIGVLLYIIDANLYGKVVSGGETPVMAPPYPGDPVNRLYQKLASLSFEILESCSVPVTSLVDSGGFFLVDSFGNLLIHA